MTPGSGFGDVTLRTARLLLRPFVAGDAEALLRISGDPEVARYLSGPAWTDIAQAHARIARDIAFMASGDSLRLAVVRASDDALIGDCCLFKFDAQCRRAELGYAQAREAWGQGYMHEALQALVGHAFTALALNRLEADIDPRNTASARSLERLGFAQEGFLRERWIVEGEVSDTGLYGLLRRDWEAKTAPVATPHLRIARPVRDLARTQAMYAQGLGLSVLGAPHAAYHFEFTRCASHAVAPSPTPEDLAVFYLPSRTAWDRACANLVDAGFKPVDPFNPYWDVQGRTFEDADGYRVVLQNAAWRNAAPAAST